jgi:hypothetical protein
MQFNAVAGTDYLLRVGGHFGGGRTTMTIACAPPPPPPQNDSCLTASVIGPAQEVPFDNTLADDAEPTAPGGGCAGALFVNDVWFEYVPVRGGLSTISLCGATAFDTRLELWSGCPGSGGTVLACDDDACGAQSRITAVLACDSSYLIRVGSFSEGSRGPGTLLVTDGPILCSKPCRADLDDDGEVNGADLGRLLLAWGGRGQADLDGDGTVSGSDLGILINSWGPCAN